MATIEHNATVEDLERLGDTGWRYDLIRGELIEMPPAGGAHGEIAAGVVGRLWAHVTTNDLGRVYTSETGFLLGRRPDVVLAPDAAFIRTERVPARQEGFYEVAPDLVVEVISPNDPAPYVQNKVMAFLDAGVRLVWVVEPSGETVTEYLADNTARILRAGEILDGGDVLPGFRVLVADIFS